MDLRPVIVVGPKLNAREGVARVARRGGRTTGDAAPGGRDGRGSGGSGSGDGAGGAGGALSGRGRRHLAVGNALRVPLVLRNAGRARGTARRALPPTTAALSPDSIGSHDQCHDQPVMGCSEPRLSYQALAQFWRSSMTGAANTAAASAALMKSFLAICVCSSRREPSYLEAGDKSSLARRERNQSGRPGAARILFMLRCANRTVMGGRVSVLL